MRNTPSLSRSVPSGTPFALIILAIIAVAAFSSPHRGTAGFSRLTLKQDASEPKRQMSGSKVQTEWNAVFGDASTGLKRGE